MTPVQGMLGDVEKFRVKGIWCSYGNTFNIKQHKILKYSILECLDSSLPFPNHGFFLSKIRVDQMIYKIPLRTFGE